MSGVQLSEQKHRDSNIFLKINYQNILNNLNRLWCVNNQGFYRKIAFCEHLCLWLENQGTFDTLYQTGRI